MQVAVGEREAADGDGEVLGEELESGFDPGLAVRDALAAEEGPPDAAGHAVVVGSDRDIHQLPLGHRHRGDSCRIRGHWSAPCGSRGRSSRIMPVLFRHACPFPSFRPFPFPSLFRPASPPGEGSILPYGATHKNPRWTQDYAGPLQVLFKRKSKRRSSVAESPGFASS